MRLPIFGVEEWLNRYETEARYDIAGVSIDALSLTELFQLTGTDDELFFKDLSQTTFNYGWIEGSPQFKAAAASLYQGLEPSQILQTNGATGANLLACYGLLEPGDHVISLYPSYQQLYDIPKSLGASVDFWTIREEEGWLPRLEELRQLIRPNTKMICINNANNPTGAVMDRAFLQELVAIAESCGAYILADEVYASFTDQEIPAIVDLYEKGISINSLSKTYSLPGLRVGWVASSPETTEVLRHCRDYTMICAGVFDDKVATLALENRSAILDRNRQLLHRNLKLLTDWVEQEELASFIPPAQTSTAFVKLAVSEPIEAFCHRLLTDYGVLVVPGSRFDIEGHVRIGYCCQTDTLVEGLSRLSLCLHALKLNQP